LSQYIAGRNQRKAGANFLRRFDDIGINPAYIALKSDDIYADNDAGKNLRTQGPPKFSQQPAATTQTAAVFTQSITVYLMNDNAFSRTLPRATMEIAAGSKLPPGAIGIRIE